MPKSPTARSLDLLRNTGHIVHKAEHFNVFSKRRDDLFGFIDICALHSDLEGVIGVQATSASNVADRIAKIRGLDAARLWSQCGNPILVMGWRKKRVGVVDRWFCRTALLRVTGMRRWSVQEIEPISAKPKGGVVPWQHLYRREACT